MKSDIKVCASWRENHASPVYTLASTCPECGGDAVNSSPAPYDPTDRYGEYRRTLKRRGQE
jgi:H/ACA ribonucleoprotein complex subunit 3